MLLFFVIFSALVIAAIGFSAALKNRRKVHESQSSKQFESHVYRSLFAPTEEETAIFEREDKERNSAAQFENLKRNLMSRAENDDFSVLVEAANIGDSNLYRKMLDLLIERNKIETEKLLRFASFIFDNKLPANKKFSDAVLAEWRKNPQSNLLPTVLHISALTDSAEIYLQTVETVFNLWKQNELKKVSANDLFAAFNAHHRLLPAGARASGAGFLLKEKLANIRREVSGK